MTATGVPRPLWGGGGGKKKKKKFPAKNDVVLEDRAQSDMFADTSVSSEGGCTAC